MAPDRIGGRYRVESAIGQGGMGTVWLCIDETLHRAVAVKQVGLLPGESVTDSARAFREARSSAGLSHRNVVTVFDVVEESGHVWLVMEHVPGRSLSEIIKQDGPIDPATVADIGAQVAEGLAALHAAGTMHRDVKPGNVLIREDGVAKISDFGIARTSGDPTLTQSGYVTGTPSYFSPALARGVDPGPADDVWALGATLYAAVEGRSPYEKRTNPVAVLHDITSAQPPRPKRAGFLEPALQRMLDRDPDSRWSMEDAGHMLRRLADTHRLDSTLQNTLATPTASRTGATPTSEHTDTSTPAPQPAPARVARERQGERRRKPPLVAIVAVALLVLVGVVLAATQLGDRKKPANASDGNKPSSSSSGKTSTGQTSTGQGSTGSTSSAQAKEAFVRDYYDKAPGGTDEAWNMLGPGEKEQGRASYNGFWRTIDSVKVESVNAREDSDKVEVTLVYRTSDQKTSTERKVEGLIKSEDGEGFLLDSDVSAG